MSALAVPSHKSKTLSIQSSSSESQSKSESVKQFERPGHLLDAGGSDEMGGCIRDLAVSSKQFREVKNQSGLIQNSPSKVPLSLKANKESTSIEENFSSQATSREGLTTPLQGGVAQSDLGGKLKGPILKY